MRRSAHVGAALFVVLAVPLPAGAQARPRPPVALRATRVTRTSVSLSWQRARGGHIAGVELFRNGHRVAFVRGHRHTSTRLACATRYRFTLRAFDARRDRSGRTRLFVTTSACTASPSAPPPAPPADTAAPGAPANVSVGAVTDTTIPLTWTASSDDVGVTGYALFLDGTRLPQDATTTSFVFSALTCSTTHTLGVQAFDAAGNVSSTVSRRATTAPCALPPPSVACPSNPLQAVQRPGQLTVLDGTTPCRPATGRVTSTSVAHDGDCHVDVNVDPAYRSLLNSVNLTAAHGNLVTEVIPSHPLPIPTVGSQVSILGTWVNDKATGWNELHPVWAFQVLSGTSGVCGTTTTGAPPPE
jgi:hypothetical protein